MVGREGSGSRVASPVFFVLTALTALYLVRLVIASTSGIDEETRRLICRLLGDLIGIVAVVYFLVRPFVVQTFWIPSDSMVPTLSLHDRILANCFTYRFAPPRRCDVVVFHPPRSAAQNEDDLTHGQDYVKRLIGLPGERVRIDRGQVYVNGVPLVEPYVPEDRRGSYVFPECLGGVDLKPGRGQGFSSRLGEPFSLDLARSREVRDRLEVVLRPREYFLLGDNRATSSDGHEWGGVAAEATVARAVFVFWPPDRLGFVH